MQHLRRIGEGFYVLKKVVDSGCPQLYWQHPELTQHITAFHGCFHHLRSHSDQFKNPYELKYCGLVAVLSQYGARDYDDQGKDSCKSSEFLHL
jgi:hypothetical protein